MQLEGFFVVHCRELLFIFHLRYIQFIRPGTAFHLTLREVGWGLFSVKAIILIARTSSIKASDRFSINWRPLAWQALRVVS